MTFNNVAAPLLFVSSGQINAQLPWNVLSSGTTGTANVVVTRSGQASAAQSLQVGPFSPGIFAIGNIAVAINSDGSIAAPAGAIPGIATKPAKIGDPGGLVIYVHRTGRRRFSRGEWRSLARQTPDGDHDAHGSDRRQAGASGFCGADPRSSSE